ncbi:MAG: hypothetical protein EAX96_15530 [Candidatus Lokiarchaeota archaeon]|nr:hypothetical protein [Candidatus Lokiarchaeota archaeon]
MEFFESKKVEAYLMFREAGLAEDELEKGEDFFNSVANGYWTSFEEYQKHFYSAFALFKILESIFMEMNMNDIKRLILDSQAGVSMTIMQETPRIFAELNPLFLKLNEKYQRLSRIVNIINLNENITIDPTMESFMEVELVFKELEKVNEKERQLAFIAITEIIEQISQMIQPFRERQYASTLRDLFRLVRKFDFFSIYDQLQKSKETQVELKLENEELITEVLESEKLKATVNILKEKIKTIDYDLQVLDRNYMDGLLSEKEYEMKKYRLKEQRKEMQNKIFEINFKLIKTMSDTY